MSLPMALGIVAVVNLMIGYALATWIDSQESGYLTSADFEPTPAEAISSISATNLTAEPSVAESASEDAAATPEVEPVLDSISTTDTAAKSRGWASSLESFRSVLPTSETSAESLPAAAITDTKLETGLLVETADASNPDAANVSEPVETSETTVARCENLFEAAHDYLRQEQDDPDAGLSLNPRAMLADAGQLEMAITSAWENDPERLRPLCVGQMEIDNLRQLTVDHGAAAVGNLSRQIERLVLSTLRRDDLVTSLGRSRFLVVFPNLDGTAAAAMLEQLRGRLEVTDFVHEDASIRTTMTAAVAQATRDESVDKFLSRAASTLVEGRNAGRNRVALHDGKNLEILEISATQQPQRVALE